MDTRSSSGCRSTLCSYKFLSFLFPSSLFFIIYFWHQPYRDSLLHSAFQWQRPASLSTSVFNSTLGFQNIFVLALPERHDRRRAVIGASNATNLQINLLDALQDANIPDSAKPPDWGQTELVTHQTGELGCLMSHVKAWRQMIQDDVTSALILESDADWDMRVRDSMEGLAEATKALTGAPITSASLKSHSRNFTLPYEREQGLTDPHSPYGNDWDVLWVGHCGASADGDHRIFTYEDASAPSDERAFIVKDGPRPGHRPPGNETRVVFQLTKVMCTAGYAISNAGARKFDSILRNGVNNEPIDRWMWTRCAEDPTLSCLAVWPQIFSPAASQTNMGNDGTTGISKIFAGSSLSKDAIAGQGIQISARVNADLGRTSEGEGGWIREYKHMYPLELRKQKEEEMKRLEEEQRKKHQEESILEEGKEVWSNEAGGVIGV